MYQNMSSEFEAEFARLAQTFQREPEITKGQSLEVMVLVALLALESDVGKDVIPLKRVGALVNGDKPQRERVDPRRARCMGSLAAEG